MPVGLYVPDGFQSFKVFWKNFFVSPAPAEMFSRDGADRLP